MPTTKTRINITLSEEAKKALFHLAHNEGVPHATKASRLLEMALELEKDKVWDKLAAKRDTKSSRFVSHKQAWK
jgi:hypothetical protein